MKWPLTPTALDSKCGCLASDRYVLLHAVWDYVLGCVSVCVCVGGCVLQSFKSFVLICQTLYHLMLFCGNLFFISRFICAYFLSLSAGNSSCFSPLPPCPCLCLFCLSLSGAVKWNNWIVNRTIKYFIIIRFLLAARHSAIAFVSLALSRSLSLSPSSFLSSCWP